MADDIDAELMAVGKEMDKVSPSPAVYIYTYPANGFRMPKLTVSRNCPDQLQTPLPLGYV